MADELTQIVTLLTEIRDLLKGQVHAPVTVMTPKPPMSVTDPYSFEAFYQAYPRKIGKGAAENAWKKIRPDQSLAQKIIDSIAAHKSSEQWRRDPQFIPHPSTYLNQRRFEDELATEAPPKPPVMYKQHQPLPKGEAPPPEVAAALSKLLGRDMAFPK